MKTILSIIWRLFRWIVFSLGIVAVLVVLLIIGIAGFSSPGKQMAARNYLMVAWPGEIGETPKFNALSSLTGQAPLTLAGIISMIDKARTDDRIQALVLNLSGSRLSFAQAEELAPAIRRFRQTGKKTYAYSQGYDLSRYRLAVMADQVWLLGSGTFDGSGPRFEIPFARNLLDRLGIEPQFEKRKDYKNALDSALESSMPAAMREAMAQLAQDIDRNALAAISAAREIPAPTLPEKLKQSLLNPQLALQNGLVDRLAYPADLEKTLDMPGVSLKQYAASSNSLTDTDMFTAPAAPGRVALITASGAITSGGNPGSFSSDGIHAGRLAAKIKQAAEDTSIAGIVLRIDSPGGEYGASDLVRDALARANKPVIVSMGSVAASGGYLIAIGGDRIIAQPSTITGSIGVIGGKFSAMRAFDQLGINWDSVSTRGDHGLNSLQPFTTEQRAVFAASIDRIYDAFVGAVAKARNLKPAEAEAAAQGRVWSGAQAMKHGLVDRLGGLAEAREEMADMLKVDGADAITLVPYPPHNPVQQVLDALGNAPMILSEINHLAGASRQLRQEPLARTLIQPLTMRPGAAYSPVMQPR